MKKKLVNELFMMSSICPTGYSVSAVNIAKALYSLGFSIKYHTMGEVHYDNQLDKSILSSMQDMSKMINVEAPCVRIWHQHSLDTFIGKGEKIGFPIFELDRFNDLEKWHLSIPDKLVVCSKWAQSIIKEQTGRDSYVVPLGVDTKVFYPTSTERDESKPFTFINIGKWEIRKGHDVLIDIFNKAFRKDDNVRLQVLAPFWASEQECRDWMQYYQNTDLGNKIEFLSRVPSHKDVAKVMNNADAGIFPVRSEGWNLELIEMMACGKPVIATDYAGHTEFCNKENCRLISPKQKEVAHDGKWFYGQGEWAAIGPEEVDKFAEEMRSVYENWQYNEAGVETAGRFSWKNSAKKLMEVLEDVIE